MELVNPLGGCCQKSITIKGLTNYAMSYGSRKEVIRNRNSSILAMVPPTCAYALVVEADTFEFSSLDLQQGIHNRDAVPMVLNWVVGNYNTCQEAQSSSSTPSSNITYACRAKNSECHDSTSGPGYLCKCREGYQGNPYILDGCQGIFVAFGVLITIQAVILVVLIRLAKLHVNYFTDIDECERKRELINPCQLSKMHQQSSKCLLHLSRWIQRKWQEKRNWLQHQYLQLILAFGICISILVLLGVRFRICWASKKRKLVQLKMEFLKQNGGILSRQLLSGERALEMIKIFSAEELKKATNSYNEGVVLGKGGNRRVYKGLLRGKKVVAIKKSKSITPMLSKLLGCCLETEVPILVYEFITKGTLSSHLHSSSIRLSWQIRLKIAKEVAAALAYLHSETSIPIIHRDVKSANVLLDDNFTAKISDFGASKLTPIGQTQITTLVQGTYGYFDPEYFCSGILTEKSDVYGYGVVLAELVTGKEALFWNSSGTRINLAFYFVSSVKEVRLVEILDDQVARR
ncbi:putative protein kinase RLK-Pelle-WAK family [Rosa chinensis]|uniref:Protein kinase domain-containing protein n=1 Tax=Rosa chinensis TaxID=74649 RepID=A0A2P6PWI5_ROSCH|nr:putative protein kinase RLK-Pelle-WAK family [Rosa chinensis]